MFNEFEIMKGTLKTVLTFFLRTCKTVSINHVEIDKIIVIAYNLVIYILF